MIEQHRRSDVKLIAKHLLEFGSKLNGHQRIESHFDQRAIGFGSFWRGQNLLQRVLHGLEQQLAFRVTAKRSQFADQSGRRSAAFSFRSSQLLKHRRDAAHRADAHFSPVDIHHGCLDRFVGDHLFHRRVGFFDAQRSDPLKCQTFQDPLIVRHSFGPRSPVDC